MFIRNLNLRKRLGMSRLMEADAGAGSAGSEGGSAEEIEGGAEENKEEEKQEEKTFTQADVDKMIKDRVAREKKGQLSKEELKAYQEWKDSQKTEDEKKNEKLTQAEIKAKEAEERALLAETKVTCLSKGVNATSVDDVVVLAKAMVSDDVTIDQAIDKVLEKYPHFKGEAATEEQKGFKKIGAPGSKGSKANEEALKAAFGIK
ncbi:hypothetical protein [Clostridium beijerinckii]|uniref:Vancomycin resistance protein YoaR n=1 Tax=Clostridium beijerinckii TaxID=1520 RepID=A0AAE5H8K2_CLOBE|nr:hypothetical protein [Clostridium beijerinckii]NSB16463.1 vancomycin resistance protein YoaR [Clostridium beijerinckii]OOM25668.1 hypothetical protein CLOBE_34630 [Clostridium beijerinckii]